MFISENRFPGGTSSNASRVNSAIHPSKVEKQSSKQFTMCAGISDESFENEFLCGHYKSQGIFSNGNSFPQYPPPQSPFHTPHHVYICTMWLLGRWDGEIRFSMKGAQSTTSCLWARKLCGQIPQLDLIIYTASTS